MQYTKPRLFIALTLSFMLVAFVRPSLLSGKWYIKNMENLVYKEKREEKNCYYFQFKEDGFTSWTATGERSGKWLQSGDTLTMQIDKDPKIYYYHVELSTADSLILTSIKEGKEAVKFFFNKKCSSFSE